MIRIENITYRIGGKPVLENLDMQVSAGHYFALAGENGAGKSTLIRIILDLIRSVKSGEVYINNRRRQDINARNDLVYLPEKFEVKTDVSGWRYLEFVFAMYRMTVERELAEKYCRAMALDIDRLDDNVSGYSKGMKQKLGLVSCFMLEKPLLILDEPLSGLDPSARFRFKSLMEEYRSENRTVFYSTHMLADAEEICDRFAILHHGNIQFEGTPQACKDCYATKTLEQAYMQCISDSNDTRQ